MTEKNYEKVKVILGRSDNMCEFCEKIAFSDDEYMQRRYAGGDFIYHDEKGMEF